MHEVIMIEKWGPLGDSACGAGSNSAVVAHYILVNRIGGHNPALVTEDGPVAVGAPSIANVEPATGFDLRNMKVRAGEMATSSYGEQ